jgi:HEAT repeat protein
MKGRLDVVAAVLFGLALTEGCYQQSPDPSPQDTARVLLALLDDPHESIRRTAAEALGKIGDHRAISSLTQSLRDREPGVRAAAARSLGQLSPLEESTSAMLVELIRDTDAGVRQAAVQALGNADTIHTLVPRLVELTAHPEPAIRRAAVQTLLLAEADTASSALVALATDNDAVIRQTAVAALGEFGERRARPVLRDRLLHDPAPGVRAEAAYRLKLSGDESVSPDLDFAVKHDASSAVRRWAQLSAEELRGTRGSDSGPQPVRSAVPATSHRSP